MSVYFYHLPIQNLVKIGVSANVEQRLNQLSTGCTERGEILRVIEGFSFKAEKWLHNQFKDLRVKGEWFTFSRDMLEINVPTKLKDVELPPFRKIGNGMKGQHGTAYPLLETMLEFSKPEAWLFSILLKTHSDKSGQSDISKLTFTKVDLNNLSKAYALLKQRDLVKRVKRQVYMINPSAIITDKWEEHKEVWKGLI